MSSDVAELSFSKSPFVFDIGRHLDAYEVQRNFVAK